MAEATLKDVIEEIRAQGDITRMGTHGSLSVAISELRKMSANQIKFFDFMKDYIIQQGQLAALANPPTPPPTTPAAPQTPTPTQPTNNFSLAGAALALGLGLAAGVNAFFDDIINAIRAPKALALVASGIRSFATALGNIFDFLKKPLDLIKSAVAGVGNIFTRIGNFFSSTFGKEGFIGRNLQKIANFVKPVLEFFKPIIDFFKRIFAPITAAFSSIGTALKFLKVAMGPVGFIIFGIIDFVKGFIKGFGENGFLGGIKEGLLEAIRGIITKPLDLLKDIVSWAAGKLGFSEFEGMLDSFSFTGMFNQFIVALEDIFEDVGKWFSTLFSDPVLAIEQYASTLLNMWKDFGGFVYNNAIKPVTDWLGSLFGVDITGTLESYVGEFMSFFKDTGSWIWNNTLKPVVDWLGEIFGGERSLKAELMGLWDEAVSVFKSNFASVANWFSGIADRIMFAAEEIWINAIANLKKNFLSLFNYLAALPEKIMIGAQQLAIDTLGGTRIGRGVLSSIGISQEGVDKQRAYLANSQSADSDMMKRLDAERAAKLADLQARRQAANLTTMAEGGVGAGASSGNNIVAPTTVGPTYTGPVYNGPVTVNNDSSTSFGLNPNDKTQMAYGF